jgi:adenylate kinase family enzyme
MSDKPIVINLFGGPGAGKSTTAAGVFNRLKTIGLNAELINEYAKDLTWENRQKALQNQVYVFGKQYHRQERCADKVDFIITDSPLLLSSIYANEKVPTVFHDLVKYCFHEYDNRNYFLERVKAYNPVGRNQTEEEAKKIDVRVKTFLDDIGESYQSIIGDESALLKIVADIMHEVNGEEND